MANHDDTANYDPLAIARSMIDSIERISNDNLDNASKFDAETFTLHSLVKSTGGAEGMKSLPEWIPDKLRKETLAYLLSLHLDMDCVGYGWDGELRFCLDLLADPQCKVVWQAIGRRTANRAFPEGQVGNLLTWACSQHFGPPSFDSHSLRQRAETGGRIHKLASQLADELQTIRAPDWDSSASFPPPIGDAMESINRDTVKEAAHSYANIVGRDAAHSAAKVAVESAKNSHPKPGGIASAAAEAESGAYDAAYDSAKHHYESQSEVNARQCWLHAYDVADLITTNPEKLLRAIANAAQEWSETRPVITKKSDAEAARRLYFIRGMVGYFRKYYDQPLWASVAALTNSIFDCDMDASNIASLCRPRIPTP